MSTHCSKSGVFSERMLNLANNKLASNYSVPSLPSGMFYLINCFGAVLQTDGDSEPTNAQQADCRVNSFSTRTISSRIFRPVIHVCQS